ncbi:hypothetical protein PUW24_12560 [Paenibacillus urinalis]|nr:hypothetical protein PUW24_12560 [Paenibacillus urinalis]
MKKQLILNELFLWSVDDPTDNVENSTFHSNEMIQLEAAVILPSSR